MGKTRRRIKKSIRNRKGRKSVRKGKKSIRRKSYKKMRGGLEQNFEYFENSDKINNELDQLVDALYDHKFTKSEILDNIISLELNELRTKEVCELKNMILSRSINIPVDDVQKRYKYSEVLLRINQICDEELTNNIKQEFGSREPLPIYK